MTEANVFEQTGDAYLALIHLDLVDNKWDRRLVELPLIAPKVPDALIESMIVGASWRERLLGISLAMCKQPSGFIDAMAKSLLNPRGMSIEPTCAALAVLRNHGIFTIESTFGANLNRGAFDGEMGWALDKLTNRLALQGKNDFDRGPNYGQIFERHVEFYDWLYTNQNPVR